MKTILIFLKKEAKMIKKHLTGVFALFLIAAVLSGCGGSNGKNDGKANDLTGAFVGSAGYLSFYPDKEVLVSLSDDYIWLLEGKENDQTYGYVFILGNEAISYDKAEAFYLHDDNKTFARINCRTETDKIIFLPGNENEAVFERRSN